MQKVALALAMFVMATPAFSESTETAPLGVGLVDMNFSRFDLSAEDGQDSDFDDATAGLPNGQARFRLGNFEGEIQGTYSTSVDDGENDNNSASFGMMGHYILALSGGEAAFSLGTMGGTSVEENDGQWYASYGAGYAKDGWMIGVGRIQRIGGQAVFETAEDFNYVNGSYTASVSEKMSVYASGYYGTGNVSPYMDFDFGSFNGANVDLGISYNVSELVSVSGSIGRFILETPDRASDMTSQANGTSIKLGVTFALGASSTEAKKAIRFDTPDLHREVTWCNEAKCGLMNIPD